MQDVQWETGDFSLLALFTEKYVYVWYYVFTINQ